VTVKQLVSILTPKGLLGSPIPFSSASSSRTPAQTPSLAAQACKAVSSLSPDLEHLIDNEYGFQTSDVTLVVGDQKTQFRAHKAILVARSEYFRSLLLLGMKESRQQVIYIDNVDATTFGHILRYIYADVLYLKPLAPAELPDACVESSEGWNVWMGAQFFCLPQLSRKVEKHIVDHSLNQYNVCSLWNLSQVHPDAKYLREGCRKYFLDNIQQVIQNKDFLSLEKDLLTEAFCCCQKLSSSALCNLRRGVLKWLLSNKQDPVENSLFRSTLKRKLQEIPSVLSGINEAQSETRRRKLNVVKT